MTHPRTTPQAANPGLSRLRPVVSCGVRAAALLALACFVSLLVPMCFDFSSFGVKAHMSQAYADGTEPPLPEGAKQRAYIDEMANQAGLEPGEFVATTVGVLTATTGVVLTRSPGAVLLDATVGDNLNNLITAADYPAWDSLSTDVQSAYGNQTNYNATKYVALMEAFDLNDGYSRFAESGGSGGGSFAFTDSETQRLVKLGNIGKNWANKIGQTFGDLRGSLAPDYNSIMYQYLYGNASSGNNEMVFDGEGVNGWNSDYTLYYKITTAAYYTYPASSGTYFIKAQAVSNVYILMTRTPSNGIIYFRLFSKTPFTYNWGGTYDVENNLNLSQTATLHQDSNGRDVYYGSCTKGVAETNVTSSSQTINDIPSSMFTYDVYGAILYGESGSGSETPGELEPDIEGYPETEIPENTPIYYPSQGIQPSTTWNQYITVQRPDNPFNPDDETSTPEWKQETKQNIQGLQGIRFDKLFPFCLYYDLQKFWQKVQTICGIQTSQNGAISTQATSAYDEIELRFYIPDVMDDTWTFDLEPLRNILLIVKPFMLVFLIGVEIISLIMLWKGILTGQ